MIMFILGIVSAMFYAFLRLSPSLDQIKPGASHLTKMAVRFALVGALIVVPSLLLLGCFIMIPDIANAATWIIGIGGLIIWSLIGH